MNGNLKIRHTFRSTSSVCYAGEVAGLFGPKVYVHNRQFQGDGRASSEALALYSTIQSKRRGDGAKCCCCIMDSVLVTKFFMVSLCSAF